MKNIYIVTYIKMLHKNILSSWNMMASIRIISKMEKENIFRNRGFLFNLQSCNYPQEELKPIIMRSIYTFIDGKYLK